ncbi:MAG: hypothetical protein GF404_08395 [candidate division Zixibacteria bacterium]|jgi:flagellar operon protein|nr:hypothetical protein [candidate division Zixibacteria bacterium]
MAKINPVQLQSAAIDRVNPTQPNQVRRAQQTTADGLDFSRHLMDRIKRRQLEIGPQETARLNQALDKAQEKGSRDSLVLLNDLAFIVNVQNRKVVTAIEKQNMNEGVFTNIDSAIIL